MRTISWGHHQSSLRDLVGTRPFGLVTDIDGTIAPIVEPGVIPPISEGARQALVELSKRIELVAVVTGRGAKQAHSMLGISQGVELIGSHGLERWQDGKVVPDPKVAAFVDRLEAAYAEAQSALSDDMYLEQKSSGFTIHYRGARTPEETRKRVLSLAEDLVSRHGVQAQEGRCIVEIGPAIEFNKGIAIAGLSEQYGLASVLYVGDDVTDLNAFRALHRMRGSILKGALCVGVASAESPKLLEKDADFLVEGVPSVTALYQWIASLTGE
jgi:trehalose 6-phosphate phosphatase